MPSSLRLVFAGTPDFAVPHLAACRRGNVDIVAVYTQPDRPAGRGRTLPQSPVKQAALAAGIPVEQPQNFKDAAAQRTVSLGYAPDLVVVVAYGLILPRKVLAIPRLGCWNVHASLLPRWRGAAPIQRATARRRYADRCRSDADGSRSGHRPGAVARRTADRRRTKPAAACMTSSPRSAPKRSPRVSSAWRAARR